MPRGDRTGPLGQGEMTGRQLGYCAGYDVAGYAEGGFYGCGRGRGGVQSGRGLALRRGAGRGGWLPDSAIGASAGPPANAAVHLKERIAQMEGTLEALKQRLETLGGEAKD